MTNGYKLKVEKLDWDPKYPLSEEDAAENDREGGEDKIVSKINQNSNRGNGRNH